MLSKLFIGFGDSFYNTLSEGDVSIGLCLGESPGFCLRDELGFGDGCGLNNDISDGDVSVSVCLGQGLGK